MAIRRILFIGAPMNILRQVWVSFILSDLLAGLVVALALMPL